MEEEAPKPLMYTKILAIDSIKQKITLGLDTQYHSQDAFTHSCDLISHISQLGQAMTALLIGRRSCVC